MNRKFRLVLGTLTGINGRAYKQGDEFQESNLPIGRAETLLARGRIVEIVDTVIRPNEKIKLAIVTSVWKRPEVFRMFMSGISNLLGTDFEINLVISQSMWNGDNEFTHLNNTSSYINALSNGLNSLKIIEIPNEPLSAKVNATTFACKNLGVHYVLCMGSDDIISPELLNEYGKHMRKGIDFIGLTDCYFYDTVSKKSLYWGGYLELYRKGQTVGAFRCLSATLLERLDWMPWSYSKTKGLDATMIDKLKKVNYTKISLSLKSLGMYAVDIKSETNVTKFQKWKNSEFIDNSIIKKQFPFIF